MIINNAMKNVVFWDVAQCRSIELNIRFGGKFLALGFFYPEDGGDMFLRNVGSIHKIHIPEDGILHTHRCETLKSYK
jgi:hypothetical protein